MRPESSAPVTASGVRPTDRANDPALPLPADAPPPPGGQPPTLESLLTGQRAVGLMLAADGAADRMLLLARTTIGVAALVATPLVETVWTPGGAITGLYLLAVSGLSAAALRRWQKAEERRRLSNLVLAADVVACLAVLVLLGGTRSGAGMLLFPLLAFEATLKFGNSGAALSLAGLAAGIGGRMAWRVGHYGLPPRWHLALIVVAATVVLIALGYALRARFAAEARARGEKEWIAASLRATVTELLATSGVPHGSMAYADLRRLLDLACTHPEVGRELGRRLAATLEPSHGLPRLTPRETEVLALVAEGLTDRQIAGRLYLSTGTVRVHVSNVVRKLGVANRAAAVDLLHGRAR